ncbi:MAG: hypothetical protein Fur0024_1200 [Patescibacteria group bacterium]
MNLNKLNPILNLKKRIENEKNQSVDFSTTFQNSTKVLPETKIESQNSSSNVNLEEIQKTENVSLSQNLENSQVDLEIEGKTEENSAQTFEILKNFGLEEDPKIFENEKSLSNSEDLFKKEKDESETPPVTNSDNKLSPFKVFSQDGAIGFDILEAIKRIKEDAIKKQSEYFLATDTIQQKTEGDIVSDKDTKKKRSKLFVFFGNLFQLLSIFTITFFLTFMVVQYELIINEVNFWIHKNDYKKEEEKILVKLDEKDDIVSEGRQGEFNFDSPAIISDNEDLSRNRIVIPAINVDAPIVIVQKNTDSALKDGLRKGVIHYPGTSFFGENGNVFLTGHSSNYAWEKGNYNYVFANLGKLKNGDKIIVYFNQKKYVYKVSKKFEIWPKETYVLNANPKDKKAEPKPLLTLMTCTPAGTNLKRLIIWADEDPDYMIPTDEGIGNSSSDINVNELPSLI